jgi:iron-sulfur cluster repair protein YtfE (RIC family)
MNGTRENSLELQQRNFEMRPVSDKFWAIEEVIHLINHILITYKSV